MTCKWQTKPGEYYGCCYCTSDTVLKRLGVQTLEPCKESVACYNKEIVQYCIHEERDPYNPNIWKCKITDRSDGHSNIYQRCTSGRRCFNMEERCKYEQVINGSYSCSMNQKYKDLGYTSKEYFNDPELCYHGSNVPCPRTKKCFNKEKIRCEHEIESTAGYNCSLLMSADRSEFDKLSNAGVKGHVENIACEPSKSCFNFKIKEERCKFSQKNENGEWICSHEIKQDGVTLDEKTCLNYKDCVKSKDKRLEELKKKMTDKATMKCGYVGGYTSDDWYTYTDTTVNAGDLVYSYTSVFKETCPNCKHTDEYKTKPVYCCNCGASMTEAPKKEPFKMRKPNITAVASSDVNKKDELCKFPVYDKVHLKMCRTCRHFDNPILFNYDHCRSNCRLYNKYSVRSPDIYVCEDWENHKLIKCSNCEYLVKKGKYCPVCKTKLKETNNILRDKILYNILRFLGWTGFGILISIFWDFVLR